MCLCCYFLILNVINLYFHNGSTFYITVNMSESFKYVFRRKKRELDVIEDETETGS